ncbi:putative ABC exporter domain-containing protein [Thermoanaerobacterium thermosaccharolyticum]|uniref:ABC exporter n=1 Tax=Thermoanaerobacterium thermosaccharolyticum M0795 TaxID=698948 RepID=L0II93_THETR|nr:putative ABC exporter domain-containing protein [Thermoanaerobacterium thermosaccharolyticum]AGB18563.1 hypothetical protein Thethe_00899 [Thermoanaerobacterium thermosaccharolyticum M0795]
MSDIKALFVLDMLKLKNFIKDIIRKPIKIFTYLLQFVWFFFIMIPVFTNRGRTFSEISSIKFSCLNGGIIAFMLLTVLLTLYSSLKQPGIILGEGDVALLLSSPIKERVIFLWYVIRASFENLFYALLFSLIIPFLSVSMKVNKHSDNLIFGYIGIFTYYLTLMPLSFLVYSISMKFNAKEKIKYFLNGLVAIIAGFGMYFIYNEKSIFGLFSYFNSNTWNYVPIIGPSKQLILSYFTGVTKYNIEFTVIQIVSIAVITLISLYFATDYYEEAINYTEKFISIKNKAKVEDYQADYTEKQLVKKKKKIDVNFAPKGPWAYIWLKMIENKREMGSIYFNYYNLAILVVSIALGYFLPKNDPMIIFALAFIYAYIGWLTSFISTISGELNKMYIYIIPGDGIEKLIAVNAVPILKSFITAILLIVPASILIKCGILNALTAILFILSFTTLANFSSSFLNTLLPSKADLKAVLPFFKLFAFVIVLAPVGAISVPLGIVTKSMTIGVLSADIAMFLMSGIFLLFANFTFERLELK